MKKEVFLVATLFCLTYGARSQYQSNDRNSVPNIYYQTNEGRLQPNGGQLPPNGGQLPPNGAHILPTIGERFSNNNNRQCGSDLEDPKDKITDFSWQFFKAVDKESPSENLILNPTTAQHLLATLAYGAEGRTFDELCNIGKFGEHTEIYNTLQSIVVPRSGNSKNELSLASAIFLNRGSQLNPNFRSTISPNTYVATVDFSDGNKAKSIREANNWSSEVTKGTIPQILNPAGSYSDTKILLASAVYFRGEWRDTFKPAGNKIFRPENKKALEVPFMTVQKYFRYGEVDHNNRHIASWVEVPYTDEKFSMLILLPQPDVPLQSLIQELDMKAFIKGSLRIGPSDVILTMPKFEMRNSKSLISPLKSMGVTTVFNDQADLRYLLEGESVGVSDMTQEAFISVDEKGTRASAVSTVNVISLSASYPDETVNFVVDRPFLAIIIEKETNIPVFFAKVMQPV